MIAIDHAEARLSSPNYGFLVTLILYDDANSSKTDLRFRKQFMIFRFNTYFCVTKIIIIAENACHSCNNQGGLSLIRTTRSDLRLVYRRPGISANTGGWNARVGTKPMIYEYVTALSQVAWKLARLTRTNNSQTKQALLKLWSTTFIRLSPLSSRDSPGFALPCITVLSEHV